MAVNYGLLEPVDIAGQFMAGRQQAQQNQLAQQQNEMRQQEFGMRQQEFATQAEDRKLKLDRANERNVFLTQLSDQMKQGGYTLNRETLGSMMNFGLKSNEDLLVNLATKGLQALDEQDQFKTEMGRIVPKPAAAPMQPGALGTGTFDVNAPAAPMNALAPAPIAAPSTNAMVGGYTRSQVEQMLTNPNARIRDMGKNLLGALPKEVAPVKNIANVNPGDFTPASVAKFNTSGNYADLIPKPTKVAGDGTGVAKAPSGYRVTATGDLEAIPGGPAAGKPMTDLQKQAYKKDFANDTANIKSAIDTANELETLTDSLVGNPDKKIKPHPGLGGITGYAGMLPSLPTGEAAKAEQKLETFKGKVKALGRTIASQQGKLGNMAVQEWQMVSDSVQAIKPTAGNLDEQMRDVVRQAKQLSKNMQDKFDLTYEGEAPAARKPAGATGGWGKAVAE